MGLQGGDHLLHRGQRVVDLEERGGGEAEWDEEQQELHGVLVSLILVVVVELLYPVVPLLGPPPPLRWQQVGKTSKT